MTQIASAVNIAGYNACIKYFLRSSFTPPPCSTAKFSILPFIAKMKTHTVASVRRQANRRNILLAPSFVVL
jgi:hypothetical protein